VDPVRFRDCACPGTPHPNGDTVTFRPQLDFDGNVAALSAIFGEGEPVASKAWRVYLFEGPVAWNLLDADGDPLPLTREALEALPFADQFEIADRGDDIYRDTVLSPLVRKITGLLRNGPTTEPSPSPSEGSSKPRARRGRSSEPSTDPSPTTSAE